MKTKSLFFILFLSQIVVSSQNTTLILQPGPQQGKDAYLRALSPTVNYGSHIDYMAQAWTIGGQVTIVRSLIEFDLSSIPSNAVILDAKLSLYYSYLSPNGDHQGANDSYIQRITSSWNENTVTWNTQPTTTSSNQKYLSQTVSNTQDFTNINVTNLVSDMIGNPTSSFGFMIRLVTEQTYRRLTFASSDYPDSLRRPKLVITYSACQTPTPMFTWTEQNNNIVFTNQTIGNTSYHWDFGDGLTSSVKDPIHNYQQNGTYQVCLTVTDSCDSKTYCDSVDFCRKPVALFDFAIDNHSVQFANGSYDATTYWWDFGDGFFSNLKNPHHTYNSNGIYIACLTVTNSCGQDTKCDTIFLCEKPIAGFLYSSNQLSFTFNNTSVGGNTYYWQFGDGNSSNSVNPTYTYSVPGIYFVCLTIIDSCGNSIFCDSIDARVTGKIELDMESINIYPNPAKDIVIVEFENTNSTPLTFKLFNILGNISSEPFLSRSEFNQIDVSRYPDGLYILEISSSDIKFSQKLIIVH